MTKSQQIQVNDKHYHIVFTTGECLDLYHVTAVDLSPTGSWLSLWSDEGMTIIDPKKILFHQIKAETCADERDQDQDEDEDEDIDVEVVVMMTEEDLLDFLVNG